ncbi:MAG: hypothetical protein Q8P24_04655 [Desulfobacterales bacterium]|nr:hypothetical protein [Desulfobacterales bacterium]
MRRERAIITALFITDIIIFDRVAGQVNLHPDRRSCAFKESAAVKFKGLGDRSLVLSDFDNHEVPVPEYDSGVYCSLGIKLTSTK